MSEKDWSKQFVKLIADSATKQLGVVEESAKVLLSNIEERTPVGDPSLWNPPYAPPGYTPGTLKASWEINYSNGSRNPISGRFTTTNELLSSHGIKAQIDNISIFNRQPYAERVENGWSTQAPQGMLRVSCLEWDSIVNRVGRGKGL